MSVYTSFGEGCFDCLSKEYVTEWRVDSDTKEEIIKNQQKIFKVWLIKIKH